MKRTHKNGRYVEWKSGGHVDFHYKNGVYVMGTNSLHITEQELRDFGFEKEKDVYGKCAEEILQKYNNIHQEHHILVNLMGQVDIAPILEKHFPRK